MSDKYESDSSGNDDDIDWKKNGNEATLSMELEELENDTEMRASEDVNLKTSKSAETEIAPQVNPIPTACSKSLSPISSRMDSYNSNKTNEPQQVDLPKNPTHDSSNWDVQKSLTSSLKLNKADQPQYQGNVRIQEEKEGEHKQSLKYNLKRNATLNPQHTEPKLSLCHLEIIQNHQNCQQRIKLENHSKSLGIDQNDKQAMQTKSKAHPHTKNKKHKRSDQLIKTRAQRKRKLEVIATQEQQEFHHEDEVLKTPQKQQQRPLQLQLTSHHESRLFPKVQQLHEQTQQQEIHRQPNHQAEKKLVSMSVLEGQQDFEHQVQQNQQNHHNHHHQQSQTQQELEFSQNLEIQTESQHVKQQNVQLKEPQQINQIADSNNKMKSIEQQQLQEKLPPQIMEQTHEHEFRYSKDSQQIEMPLPDEALKLIQDSPQIGSKITRQENFYELQLPKHLQCQKLVTWQEELQRLENQVQIQQAEELKLLHSRVLYMQGLSRRASNAVEIKPLFNESYSSDINFVGAYSLTLTSMNNIFANFPTFMSFINSYPMLSEASAILVKLPQLPLEDKIRMKGLMMSENIERKLTQRKVEQNSEETAFIFDTVDEQVTEKCTIDDFEDNAASYESESNLEFEVDHETNTLNHIFKNDDEASYATVTSKSFFDTVEDTWDLGHLANDLNRPERTMMFWMPDKTDQTKKVPFKKPGYNIPTIRIGQWKTLIPLQLADDNLGTISFMHTGMFPNKGSRIIYSVQARYANKIHEAVKREFPSTFDSCNAYLRHKTVFIKPTFLEKHNILYSKVIQKEDEYLIIQPGCYYFGVDLGFNITETVLFHVFETFKFFKTNSYVCFCEDKDHHLPKDIAMRKYQPASYKRYKKGLETDNASFSRASIRIYNDIQFKELYETEHKRKRKLQMINATESNNSNSAIACKDNKTAPKRTTCSSPVDSVS